MNDPFAKLIQIFRDEGKYYNPHPSLIGQVISEYPKLLIKISDLQIDKDNILIADGLASSLKNGNEVFIIPMNQKFMILCKVVSL